MARALSVVTVALAQIVALTVTHGQVQFCVRGNISPGATLITTGTLPNHGGGSHGVFPRRPTSAGPGTRCSEGG